MKSLNPIPYTIYPQDGYMALMSAIVISVLLIAITLSLGMSSFFGRFDILDSESKEISAGLAEACVDKAILEASMGTYFVGGLIDFDSDGDNDCTVILSEADNPVSGQTMIKTQAFFNKSYTNLKVVVDSSTYNVISWIECTNLTSNPASC